MNAEQTLSNAARVRPDRDLGVQRTVAAALVDQLWQAGIDHIVYVPGGPMMPFVSAAFDAGRFRFVLCRHEQGAGFIAEGIARVRRRPALVLVTAGPGVTNVVTPLYVAKQEMTPLLVLSAQVSQEVNGLGAAQELDTVTLLRPVTKRSTGLSHPREAAAVLRHLLTESNTGPAGPVHLSVSCNQWRMEAI